MPEATTDDIVGHGMEAAKVALEYCSSFIKDMTNPTEDEARALIVAIAACIAGLNTKLFLNCAPTAYKESQQLILSFMDAAAGGIAQHIKDTPEGEKA